MNSGDYTYIWQAGDWPSWRFELAALTQPLADVSRAADVRAMVYYNSFDSWGWFINN